MYECWNVNPYQGLPNVLHCNVPIDMIYSEAIMSYFIFSKATLQERGMIRKDDKKEVVFEFTMYSKIFPRTNCAIIYV